MYVSGRSRGMEDGEGRVREEQGASKTHLLGRFERTHVCKYVLIASSLGPYLIVSLGLWCLVVV